MGAAKLWRLLRQVVLRILWLSRSSAVFEGAPSPFEKTDETIWKYMLEYGRTVWSETLKAVGRATSNEKISNILKVLDSTWTHKHAFCS